MSDDNIVTALLAQRAKHLSRFDDRRDSFASTSAESASIYSPPEHPYQHRAEPNLGATVHDELLSFAIDSSDLSRMSVLGPKIHKNGHAPWELDPLAETSDDGAESQSIFGRRSKAKSSKATPATTATSKPSKGRHRSKTLTDSMSPVSALKGLGFGVLSGSNPGSRAASPPNDRRPSLQKSLGGGSSIFSSRRSNSTYDNDDDTRSVSTTATVTDPTTSVYEGVRYASHLTPHTQIRNVSTGTRARSQTVSHLGGPIPGDTGRVSQSSSSSSVSIPSLPQITHSSDLQIRTSIFRPEDMFRSSVASELSVDGSALSDKHRHPYSNPELLRVSPAVSAFSDDSNSPSPLSGSPAPADTPSPGSFVHSPSSSTLTESQSNGNLDSSQGSSNRKVVKKKAPPPPLTLRSSPSASSLASTQRHVSKSSLKQRGRDDEESSSTLYGLKNGNASSLSVRTTPRPYGSDGAPSTPITAVAMASRTNSSQDPRQQPGNRLHPSSPSPRPTLAPPSPARSDLPSGMLTFPGSPAYQLISLEQAQAKATRDRVRTTSGAVEKSARKEKEGGGGSGSGSGIGGLVARMRMNSEAGAVMGSSYTDSPVAAPEMWASSSNSTTSTTTTATTTKTPVLRQRKSGFLKLFVSGNSGGDRSPTVISPPTPLGFTANGLPSPFSANEVAPRTNPMTLRDIHSRPGGQQFTQQRTASAPTAGQTQSSRAENQESWQSTAPHSSSRPGIQSRRPTHEQSSLPFVELVSSGEEGGGGLPRSNKDGEPMLRLRHLSTNFLNSLPLDYLSQMDDKAAPASADGSDRAPSLSPATPSFNSVLSISSMYASSESSLSPLPTPNSMHQHQQQHLSPPAYLRHHQQHHTGFTSIAEAGADSDHHNIIVALQEQLAATKKQMRIQTYDLEKQVRELKGQVERLQQSPQRESGTMMCGECGSHDIITRMSDFFESRGDEDGRRGSSDSASVVNRPRVPTGAGGRFGSRYG